ncbi:MAG: hypothetical protein V1702_05105 [Candidatus Woesearchaeota archaeon]
MVFILPPDASYMPREGEEPRELQEKYAMLARYFNLTLTPNPNGQAREKKVLVSRQPTPEDNFLPPGVQGTYLVQPYPDLELSVELKDKAQGLAAIVSADCKRAKATIGGDTYLIAFQNTLSQKQNP